MSQAEDGEKKEKNEAKAPGAFSHRALHEFLRFFKSRLPGTRVQRAAIAILMGSALFTGGRGVPEALSIPARKDSKVAG